jgi:AraC-like DNA-binding protein
MAIRFLAPSAELVDVVSRIYIHETGPLATGPWLITPDGDFKLIFPVRGPVRCTIGSSVRLHLPARIIVSGMRAEPGYLEFPEGVEAVGVILKPEAAHRLFAMRLSELTNRTFDAEELLGARAGDWAARLIGATGWDARVALVQLLLLELLSARSRHDAEVVAAVRRLRQSAGAVSIEQLARDLRWSRRRLERRFLDGVGVTPKNLASVFRFHTVYKALRRTGQGSVAFDHYYDQSHFIRDFKRFTGLTPSVYAQTADYGRFYIPA